MNSRYSFNSRDRTEKSLDVKYAVGIDIMLSRIASVSFLIFLVILFNA